VACRTSISNAPTLTSWPAPAFTGPHGCTGRYRPEEIAMTDGFDRPMAGKTVLITGGTTGIGRATADVLAARGATVGITGRDKARTEAAAREIAAATGNPKVTAFPGDLSSQAEVRRLAAEVLDAYPRLDVLINNVGGFWATRRVTADGLEHTFAVNHLAPFLLTELLRERLVASAPARIVNVSSGAHTMGTMDFDDLQGERRFSGQAAYNQSKLANVLFTYELARRLAGTGVTANVLHPGVVRTRFAAEDPSTVWKVALPIIRPLLRSPARGAQTSIYLASAAEVEGVTGEYFIDCKARKSSKSSYDTAAATRLWQVSEELVERSTPKP
jgi:retinol dehydrogenase 14